MLLPLFFCFFRIAQLSMFDYIIGISIGGEVFTSFFMILLREHAFSIDILAKL